MLNERRGLADKATLGADHPNTGRSAMFLALTLRELHAMRKPWSSRSGQRTY